MSRYLRFSVDFAIFYLIVVTIAVESCSNCSLRQYNVRVSSRLPRVKLKMGYSKGSSITLTLLLDLGSSIIISFFLVGSMLIFNCDFSGFFAFFSFFLICLLAAFLGTMFWVR
jgi:hypothetical protein